MDDDIVKHSFVFTITANIKLLKLYQKRTAEPHTHKLQQSTQQHISYLII